MYGFYRLVYVFTHFSRPLPLAVRRGHVEVPLVQLFPPQSPIFGRLFLLLAALPASASASAVDARATGSAVDINASYDDMTGDSLLHMKVLPAKEVLA